MITPAKLTIERALRRFLSEHKPETLLTGAGQMDLVSMIAGDLAAEHGERPNFDRLVGWAKEWRVFVRARATGETDLAAHAFQLMDAWERQITAEVAEERRLMEQRR